MPAFPLALRAAVASVLAFAAPVRADDAAENPGGRLSLELNALADVAGGCQLSFLVTNGTPADLAAVVFEAVLIDTQGRVDRLTLFDLGALPAGRPRVRQFLLPDTGCAGLGTILINGASRCEIAGAAADAAVATCTRALELSTRTDVGMIG